MAADRPGIGKRIYAQAGRHHRRVAGGDVCRSGRRDHLGRTRLRRSSRRFIAPAAPIRSIRDHRARFWREYRGMATAGTAAANRIAGRRSIQSRAIDYGRRERARRARQPPGAGRGGIRIDSRPRPGPSPMAAPRGPNRCRRCSRLQCRIPGVPQIRAARRDRPGGSHGACCRAGRRRNCRSAGKFSAGRHAEYGNR